MVIQIRMGYNLNNGVMNMKSVKITYGVKGDITRKKRKRFLTPLDKLTIKKEKAALKELIGLWEEKDTTFFDRR